jgi:hypothetical protein
VKEDLRNVSVRRFVAQWNYRQRSESLRSGKKYKIIIGPSMEAALFDSLAVPIVAIHPLY